MRIKRLRQEPKQCFITNMKCRKCANRSGFGCQVCYDFSNFETNRQKSKRLSENYEVKMEEPYTEEYLNEKGEFCDKSGNPINEQKIKWRTVCTFERHRHS